MKENTVRLILMTLLLSLAAPVSAWAASSAAVATQVREQWAKARVGYLAAVKPYAADPLVPQYTKALDKAGQSLEKFIQLKSSAPAPAPATLTPVVDQLTKDLTALRLLKGKASGNLASALGSALVQQNQVTQYALKNMR